MGTDVTTTSDVTGNFNLIGVPSGDQVLDLDTGTSNPVPDGLAPATLPEALEPGLLITIQTVKGYTESSNT